MTIQAVARRSDMLRLRIVSAAILVPAALVAVWFGPPWITIIVGLAGLAMAWEWGRLAAGQFGLSAALIILAVALSVGVAATGRFPLAPGIAFVCAIAAALARRAEWGWILVGTMWIACGCVAFVWLTETGDRVGIFWLLGVVWATDIFAYFVGKAVGGPRLAPQLSPNKTWAGFAGGLAGGAIVGIVVALVAYQSISSMVAISLGVSLVAQGGDLAESLAKRHFAVKDTSGLIPGHGGVLDRLDGLLAATIAVALLTFISKVHFG